MAFKTWHLIREAYVCVQVLKRDYSTFTPRDTFDEVRRVQLKSKENMLAGASTKILGINHSSTLTEALHAEDDSGSRNLRQSDARALELVKPIAMNNAPSPNINALDTEAAVDVELTHTLKLTALPPETTPSRVAYDSRLSVPVSLPDEKKAHFSHPVLYHFLISIFFYFRKKKKELQAISGFVERNNFLYP